MSTPPESGQVPSGQSNDPPTPQPNEEPGAEIQSPIDATVDDTVNNSPGVTVDDTGNVQTTNTPSQTYIDTSLPSQTRINVYNACGQGQYVNINNNPATCEPCPSNIQNNSPFFNMCSDDFDTWYPAQLLENGRKDSINSFYTQMNQVMTNTLDTPLSNNPEQSVIKDQITDWYISRLSDEYITQLMNKNNYRPDDPNRLDLFKSEISSTRGSIVTCVEPNDPDSLPDGIVLSSGFYDTDANNSESRNHMLTYPLEDGSDSSIVRWDGCDTSSGTSKFGPKNITMSEYRDWSKSQPASQVNLQNSTGVMIDESTSFGDMSKGVMGMELFPINRDFEDCINELLNDYEDNHDAKIIDEIHEIRDITDLKKRHMMFIKRKLEMMIISSSKGSVKQCIIDHVLENPENGFDICSTDLAYQMLVILNILFSTIGFNLNLNQLDSDDIKVRKKLIEIIDTLGDLIPKSIDKIIEISEDLEQVYCSKITGKTAVLKEMNKRLFNPQKKSVNFNVGSIMDVFKDKEEGGFSDNEFNRIAVVGGILLGILKFI